MKNAGPGPSVTSMAGAVTELEPNGRLSDGAAVGMKSDQLGFHDIVQVTGACRSPWDRQEWRRWPPASRCHSALFR